MQTLNKQGQAKLLKDMKETISKIDDLATGLVFDSEDVEALNGCGEFQDLEDAVRAVRNLLTRTRLRSAARKA